MDLEEEMAGRSGAFRLALDKGAVIEIQQGLWIAAPLFQAKVERHAARGWPRQWAAQELAGVAKLGRDDYRGIRQMLDAVTGLDDNSASVGMDCQQPDDGAPATDNPVDGGRQKQPLQPSPDEIGR